MKPIGGISVLDLMDDEALLAPWYRGPSWDPWCAVLKGAYGLAMTAKDRRVFRRLAQRNPPPGGSRETVIVAGRRGGKDAVTAAATIHAAIAVDHRPYLRPGERATCLVLACDKSQASTLLGYIKGLFSIPMLKALVTRETRHGLELTNQTEIIVAPNNFRALRGRTLAHVVMNEVGFWRNESSANPDVEVYRSLLPAMITLPTAKLWIISSPYRKAGLLYQQYERYFGKNDPDVLVIQAASTDLNPTLDRAAIARDIEADPEAAKSEWLAEFRDGVSIFLPRELLMAGVDRDVLVRPPQGFQYFGFCDAAGGTVGGDSFTCAIAHREGEIVVLDCLFERAGPFHPQNVVREIADLLRSYGLGSVAGDHYSASWIRAAFADVGIEYTHSRRDRSSIYGDFLPLVTAGRVRLLDSQRLIGQLAGLERIASAGGRDKIDHQRGQRDDLANVVAGALTLAAEREAVVPIVSAWIGDGDTGRGRPGVSDHELRMMSDRPPDPYGTHGGNYFLGSMEHSRQVMRERAERERNNK